MDPAAVRCTCKNVAAVGGEVYEGDLYQPLPDALQGRVDVLVANAPYIPTDAISLLPPTLASTSYGSRWMGAPTGSTSSGGWAADAPLWLVPAGHLLVETSEQQAPYRRPSRPQRTRDADSALREDGRHGRHRDEAALGEAEREAPWAEVFCLTRSVRNPLIPSRRRLPYPGMRGRTTGPGSARNRTRRSDSERTLGGVRRSREPTSVRTLAVSADGWQLRQYAQIRKRMPPRRNARTAAISYGPPAAPGPSAPSRISTVRGRTAMIPSWAARAPASGFPRSERPRSSRGRH